MTYLPESLLRNYQRKAADMIVEAEPHDGLLLGMDPGLGKTVSTLTAIIRLLNSQKVAHVLIIAPLLVAEETWPAEIESWEHTQVINYEVITGSEDRRIGRLQLPAEVHIINKENVQWLVQYWGPDWPYDMLVLDESSTFKNPAMTNRPSKAAIKKWELSGRKGPKPRNRLTRFGSLCRIRRHLERVVLLTGTMSPNGLGDLWSQFYLLDGGRRLYSTHTDFQRRWFFKEQYGFDYHPREGAFEEISDRISDAMLTLKAEDWIDLPDRIDNHVWIDLPPAVMKKYRKFARTMYLEEEDIEAVNQGVLTGKLLQLANGSVYNEDREPIEIHALKLDALDNLVSELNGAPILIAYSFEFDLQKLRKKYPKAEVLGESEGQVKRWNSGKIPMLLAHPAAAAYGLNLQKGGHVMAWYGLPWSLELYIQFNARLHRSGQEHPVIIHHILARGTVDERVMAVLADKAATQQRLIEATMMRPGDI